MAKTATKTKTAVVVPVTPVVKSMALTLHESLPASMPMAVLERAVRDGADVDVLERLLGLQERWEATQARKAFDAAMSAIRETLPTITKNREVDFTSPKGRTNYRYEDLAGITAVVSPLMAQHGLSFRWQIDSSAPGQILSLIHISEP